MRKIHVTLATLALVCLAGLTARQTVFAGDGDNDEKWEKIELARVERGFAIAPVPLDIDNRDHNLVGLGSYLVNGVVGCGGCHTHPEFAPGGDPYLGQPKKINTTNYLAGGRVFGPFISRNITPENGKPAGLTYEQFLAVFRHGTDFDMKHPQISPLLQVMPWTSYQNMRERDIKAIYEYLSSIPSAPTPTPGP